MNLSDIQSIAAAENVVLMADAGKLVLDGPDGAVDELIPMVRRWKPELLMLLSGESITDVGQCDHCNADLIGLPVSHDGFVNRVCGACGEWAICLPPDWTLNDLAEHIVERSAIMEHDGQLSRDDADRKAFEVVRVQMEEQKSIFDDADRNRVGLQKVIASPARLTTEAITTEKE